MNPARPRAQAFTAGVVKPVSSDCQNTEAAKERRPVTTIPTRAPSEAHMTGQKHSDKHQNRHRCGTVDLHRPRLSRAREVSPLHLVVRIDVMVVEVERDLKIICEAVLKFFVEIEHTSQRDVTPCSNSHRPFGNKSVV